MLKKINFVPSSVSKFTWLFAVLGVLTLGVSACGVTPPANSLTPTPTTLMGYIAPLGESGGVATGESTPDTGDSGTSGGSVALEDICSLVSQSEAEGVLGQTVSTPTPGTDPDSISGGTLYFCTYLGSGLALVVSRVDLSSLEEAEDAMEQELAQMVSDDSSITTGALAAGLGDQAFWSTSERAASVTVMQGSTVFSIAVGGNVGDPAAYKTALQDLAASVAGRL